MSRGRVRAARIVAVAADLLQVAVIPAFAGGLTSPVNDILDVAVGAAMVLLVGWHWAFLPSFLSELVPFWDLAPTWTVAALLATRRRGPKPPGGAIETEVVREKPTPGL